MPGRAETFNDHLVETLTATARYGNPYLQRLEQAAHVARSCRSGLGLQLGGDVYALPATRLDALIARIVEHCFESGTAYSYFPVRASLLAFASTEIAYGLAQFFFRQKPSTPQTPIEFSHHQSHCQRYAN